MKAPKKTDKTSGKKSNVSSVKKSISNLSVKKNSRIMDEDDEYDVPIDDIGPLNDFNIFDEDDEY
jgi:hypothetical protein